MTRQIRQPRSPRPQSLRPPTCRHQSQREVLAQGEQVGRTQQALRWC